MDRLIFYVTTLGLPILAAVLLLVIFLDALS